jgi:hypothetical protein
MPFWCAIGGYSFMGHRYFTNRDVFLWGSLALCVEYWVVIGLLTFIIRQIIHRFPGAHQTALRMTVMLVTVISLIVILSVPIAYLFSLVPLFNTPFRWDMLRTVLVIGLSFDVIFCIVLGGSYLHRQWQTQWQEKEQMKRASLQLQFDQLKGQVNPHFLFNSLNSLTELIGDDPQQAETFVEELAKVYRYLLQANRQQPLVPLSTELAFIRSYTYLLNVRYGSGIVFLIDVAAAFHAAGQLEVRNNRQPKKSSLPANQINLADLNLQYQLAGSDALTIQETDGYFTVVLPLLPHDTIEPAPQTR